MTYNKMKIGEFGLDFKVVIKIVRVLMMKTENKLK